MTEQKIPTEQPQFETDTVQANQAEQQGLGLGERELQAQREAGEPVDAEIDQDDKTTAEDAAEVQSGQEPQAPQA